MEFVGNGVISRAIIRKGGIACFEKCSLVGKEVRFYDDQGAKINSLKLWINGELIQVEDVHRFPYDKKEQTKTVLAIH